MKYLIVPLLVEFEMTPSGVEMTLWASVNLTKFQVTIDGSIVLFESTGRERYIGQGTVQGFRSIPKDSVHYEEVDRSLYPEACLIGSLRLPLEEIAPDRVNQTCRIQGRASFSDALQAKP